MVLILLCGVASASVRWEYMWDANELPADFMEGTVFAHVTHQPAGASVSRFVSSGFYDCTTSSTANASYKTLTGVFGENGLLSDSTIEVRFQNDYADGTQATPYYVQALMIYQTGVGSLGFKISWSHQCNPYEYNSAVNLYKNLDGWSTVRVLLRTENGVMTHADLYYLNADDDWVYGNTSFVTPAPTTADTYIMFGDIGSNWGGHWVEDYFYFTSQGATVGDILHHETNIADINGDGTVDILDLAIMATEWLD